MRATPRFNWKYAAVPTLIVLFLAMLPQVNIWLVKGSSWNGAYVVSNYDEVAYSAYVNALIEGRPRKNDPFVGRDNVEGETLYSIQAVPPYTIASVAKVFGISTSEAFVLLNFLTAIFSSLAVFFFLRRVTGDELLSAVGVLVVLLLGTAVAYQGELQHLTIGNYLCDFFPWARRYQPGFAFPIFFIFCLFVFRSFDSDRSKTAIISAVLSGLTFTVLVFSYFYLWTAAAAWVGVATALWFYFRPADRGRIVVRAGVVGAFALAAVIPFFLMLAHREKRMDDVQLLNLTRAPNLFELPELFGAAIAVGLVWLVRKKSVETSSPAFLTAAAFSLTPFILFNQQVITGHSLQPVHYELFIANYMILTAAMLFLYLVMSTATELSVARFRRGLVYIGVAAAIWGFIESSATARRNAGYESARDGAMAVLKYLDKEEPARLSATGEYPAVFSPDMMIADFVPTVTSYRALWSPHTNSAGGVDQKENRELFYRFLYFSRFGEADLQRALDEPLYEVVAALFGGGRALPELSGGHEKITAAEKQAEILRYREYISNFGAPEAYAPEIGFVIVSAEAEPDLANIDRWYVRDQGKTFGLFRLYKLTPKQQ